MKVAILSESPADEAALRILVEGILRGETEPVMYPSPATRGWHPVLLGATVRSTLNHLHYRTDADALIVAVDSDESPVHQRGHDEPGAAAEKCRLCRLRQVVSAALNALRPRQGRGPIKTALGLAVPAIEAWLLVGLQPRITEAAWIQGLQSGRLPYTKPELKAAAYGSDRPSLEHEVARAREHARRIVEQNNLRVLEQLFPSGFGALAGDVRGW